MASEMDAADSFHISGPTHMMSRAGDGSLRMMTDWDNEEHRRCIVACIINGTYVTEKDGRRPGGEQLAPAWWRSFHFRRMEFGKYDHLIFGAIYEHVPPAGAHGRRDPSAPDYVVALRGTMLHHPKAIQDLYHDCKIILNTLSGSQGYQRAHRAVSRLLRDGPAGCVVWLAGHSLGASLALEVGRDMMADHGISLPTFLFNPPQVSLAPVIDTMHLAKVAKRGLYAANYLVKAGVGLFVSPHKERMKDLFQRLSSWAPVLYVHEEDLICRGFIDYFEQRQQLEERFRGAAHSAVMLSYRDMLFYALGKEKKRPHLLPSVTLRTNSSFDSEINCRIQKLVYAHKLQQWWKPRTLGVKHFTYPVERK